MICDTVGPQGPFVVVALSKKAGGLHKKLPNMILDRTLRIVSRECVVYNYIESESRGGESLDTATVKANLPVRLLSEMESLVRDGWFEDIDDLIADALRRYLDSHQPDLMELYIRQDVEWGWHGEE